MDIASYLPTRLEVTRRALHIAPRKTEILPYSRTRTVLPAPHAGTRRPRPPIEYLNRARPRFVAAQVCLSGRDRSKLIAHPTFVAGRDLLLSPGTHRTRAFPPAPGDLLLRRWDWFGSALGLSGWFRCPLATRWRGRVSAWRTRKWFAWPLARCRCALLAGVFHLFRLLALGLLPLRCFVRVAGCPLGF